MSFQAYLDNPDDMNGLPPRHNSRTRRCRLRRTVPVGVSPRLSNGNHCAMTQWYCRSARSSRRSRTGVHRKTGEALVMPEFVYITRFCSRGHRS